MHLLEQRVGGDTQGWWQVPHRRERTQGLCRPMRNMHQMLIVVVRPFTWAAQRRDWWDASPAWARWAQPGDRRFTGRLLAACGAVGIVGMYVYPIGFPLAGPVWIGLTLAVAMFPTRRRLLLALLLGAAAMWPLYPRLFSDSDWLPWPWTISIDRFTEPLKAD